ncbi:MAG: EAL domain-containing protein [Pseudomonadota bacterium]|nr:EAL domain-containing protein [Pseudomonadota bacterium]
MSADKPVRPEQKRETTLEHAVRLPFVVVALVVAVICILAWTDGVPARYTEVLHVLSGLVGLLGIGLLWFMVRPAIARLHAREGIAFVPGAGDAGWSGPARGERTALGGPGSRGAMPLTDRLTGLGNRGRMLEKFNRLVDGRTASQAFTVGLMNIDGMKPVNELHGTIGGDDVLKQCAQRLSAAVDGDGFVFRFGGDEFGFIFPSADQPHKAEEKGRLMQNVLVAPFHIEGRTVRLTGSFGMAIHHADDEDFERIIDRVDTALHYSKRRGRGRVTLHSMEIERLANESARLERALSEAIADHQVKPHFQPIISLQDGSLLGFEALARWTDPELGEVPPSRFIPLAEERGIIVPLTESLLVQAASAAAGWPDDLFLSFNLSGLQLVDFATAQHVRETLRKAGLPSHRLEIEVTESAIVSDPETAARIIDDLHQAGIRVSMDDFGTGQSSLGRLRELRLDKVKIDRTFIKSLGEDKTAQHIVRAILELCAGLELTVVAEGIEKLSQADTLRRYGCHAGQGFLFGKPQDALQTLNYIREFARNGDAGQGSRVA